MLELRDLSRVDMIISPEAKYYVLGVNVSPGMTEISLFPRAVTAAGLDLGEVLGELIMASINNRQSTR
jgi:D-alanine-D-alanine ligase